MKAWQKGGLVAAALALCIALAVWRLPARWALWWLAPQLHGLQLQQVQGSLWDGRSAQVRTPTGRDLGAARWQLSRRTLLGQTNLQVALAGPLLNFDGAMRSRPRGQVEWRNVSLRFDLALLPVTAGAPFGQPGGVLTLRLDHALLQGGWPLQLDASGQWQSAQLRAPTGELILGTLHWQAEAQAGVIHAQLRDAGRGPLQVATSVQLSPLGWRLDARLRARQTASAPLRQWLVSLGPIAADGSVTVHRDGGLARLLPAEPSPLPWK